MSLQGAWDQLPGEFTATMGLSPQSVYRVRGVRSLSLQGAWDKVTEFTGKVGLGPQLVYREPVSVSLFREFGQVLSEFIECVG